MSARFIEPVTLTGSHATLLPLAPSHADGIKAAAADGELWNLWYTSVPAPDRVGAWLDAALDMRERQGAMPFVVRDNASGEIVARRATSASTRPTAGSRSATRGTHGGRSERPSTLSASAFC